MADERLFDDAAAALAWTVREDDVFFPAGACCFSSVASSLNGRRRGRTAEETHLNLLL